MARGSAYRSRAVHFVHSSQVPRRLDDGYCLDRSVVAKARALTVYNAGDENVASNPSCFGGFNDLAVRDQGLELDMSAAVHASKWKQSTDLLHWGEGGARGLLYPV